MCTQKCKLNYFSKPSTKILHVLNKLSQQVERCGGSEDNYQLLLDGSIGDETVEQCTICGQFKLKILQCQGCHILEQDKVKILLKIQTRNRKDFEETKENDELDFKI